jgi:hypothetical protein
MAFEEEEVHPRLGTVATRATVEQRVEAAAVRGINAWARRVLRRARVLAPLGPPVQRKQNGQFAPRIPNALGELHPGHLKASGVIWKEAEASEAHPNAEVAFTAVYAAAQHENIDWNHPQGGQAKYLQAAFVELLPELPGEVQKAIHAELGLGFPDDIVFA